MSIFSTFRAQPRLLELEERSARLERDMKDLRLEWENAYDKLRQMMGRIAKRTETLREPGTENNQQHLPGVDPSTGPFLSPHQQEMQRKILARRGLTTGNGG